MMNMLQLRALVDGHSGYGELLPGRIGSLIGENRPAFLLIQDKLNGAELPLKFVPILDSSRQDGESRPPEGTVSFDDNWRQLIQTAAASVGRVEVKSDDGTWIAVATCFRVGSSAKRVATAAHVAEALLSQGSELDPGVDQQPHGAGFREAQVVFEKRSVEPADQEDTICRIDGIELLHGKLDLMLCHLSEETPSTRNPLLLASHNSLSDDEYLPLAVIGYPTALHESDGEEDEELFEKLLSVNGQKRVGVKRASVGWGYTKGLLNLFENTSLQHDASTLRGSSGSPVISLLTGELVGLHFGGKGDGLRNRCINLSVACRDPALKERIDKHETNPPVHQFEAWEPDDDNIRIGRVLNAHTPVFDGEEFVIGSGSINSSIRFSDNPTVQKDRRDIRDRFYTASLNKPLDQVLPDDEELYLPQLQFRQNECTGFAIANALDRQLMKQERDLAGGVSARMLYETGRLQDEFVDDLPGGSSLRGVIKGFYHNGVCPAEVADKVSSTHWSLSVEMAKAARSITLGAYYRLAPNLPDFQMAIQEAGAVVVSAWLHSGWKEPKKGSIVYKLDRKKSAHAFVLVGYDKDGFIVQNSWDAWGFYRSAPGSEGKSGYAHWSYADWAMNVIDAWVLQLAPRAPGAHNLPLRSYTAYTDPIALDLPVEIAALPEPRRIAIIGHIAHAERTGLVDAGRIGAGQQSLRETALYLSTNKVWEEEKYDAIAFIFHDPFLGAEAAARLSAHLVPRFKAANVYAMNIVYGVDEVRSLTARMNDEANFTRDVSAGIDENLTPYFNRRAKVVGKPLMEAYLQGLEQAAMPGGAIWNIVASLCLEALHRPPEMEVRSRGIHVLSFGAGALAASAVFDNQSGQGFVDEISGDSVKLNSVSLLAPLTYESPSKSYNAPRWAVEDPERILEFQLASACPKDIILPAYDGDWCDLLASMLGPGGYRPRKQSGSSRGPDRLSQIVIDGKTLNKVMKNIVSDSRLTAWQRF